MSAELPLHKYKDLILRFAQSYVPMNDEDFKLAEPYLRVTRIDKGQRLCTAGEFFHDLCFVAQGLFKAFFITDEGVTWIRSFSCEGQHVGPLGSMLLGQPSSVSIEALEDSVVVSIKHAHMLKLYEHGAKWERFGRLIAEEHYKWWEYREHQLMVPDAAGRLQSAMVVLSGIIGRITQRDLAQYLRVTPEALSRIKKAR
jgi:CRP-like cAMP-binding protein